MREILGKAKTIRELLSGLLLLPKKFNASYGDLAYTDKRPQHNGQIILARTLCDEAYERNPGLRQFIDHTERAKV